MRTIATVARLSLQYAVDLCVGQRLLPIELRDAIPKKGYDALATNYLTWPVSRIRSLFIIVVLCSTAAIFCAVSGCSSSGGDNKTPPSASAGQQKVSPKGQSRWKTHRQSKRQQATHRQTK